MNNSRPPVHTIFLAELGVRQPFVGRREVEQVPKKGQFFGTGWGWEARAFFDPHVNERSENKCGENGQVV